MHRIDGPGAVEVLPATRADGATKGFFSGGSPSSGQQATTVTYEWANSVQEELVNVIQKAGIVLDKKDNTQLLQAIMNIIPKTGYLLERKFFPIPTPFAGWEVLDGSVIEGIRELHPRGLEELLKDPEFWFVTEEVWQAQHNSEPWNGVGGCTKFVYNESANTLRLPDTRGMYVEAEGFDGLVVGGVHGDIARRIIGSVVTDSMTSIQSGANSALYYGANNTINGYVQISPSPVGGLRDIYIDTSRLMSTGVSGKPRAFGDIHCVYLGGA